MVAGERRINLRRRGDILSLLVAMFVAAALWLGVSYAGVGAVTQSPPVVADAGVLTEWPLPSNTGPWNLKWDAVRNLIWFGEGTHSDPGLDRIGAINPDTSQLMEWGVPTAGGYVHGTAMDRSNNVWFTEVRLSKIARLQPELNTITEWPIDPNGFAHGITVDDIVPNATTVWFSERDSDVVSSLELATGVYMRHHHPFLRAWPHNVVVAPDHSVWFVETCGNRVGRLAAGTTDTWSFWQPPTPNGICAPPNGIGPLYGLFVNGDFWYSEPYNGNIIRLRPSENTFTIWRVPGGGSRMVTQTGGDPEGNIFFTEMNANKIGRLEPGGASAPTVIVVTPTVVSQPAPQEATSQPVSVVYTPIITQLTPVPTVLVGTRNGSFVEWSLPPIQSTALRRIGPGRAWYGGGGFWVSELTANKVARFVPYTSTPGPSATPTRVYTSTMTSTPSNTPLYTPTVPQPSYTPMTTSVATDTPVLPTLQPSSTAIASVSPSAAPCMLAFTDVPSDNTFYVFVRCLACRGIISGYNDGTFKPNNLVTRGQLAKIVSNAANFQEEPGAQIFEDVAPDSTFYQWINRLTRRGYMSGYTCGGPGEPCVNGDRPYFRPTANATRAQTSKIVSNAAQYNETPTEQTFEDVSTTHPFYQWIQRLAAQGAMGGYPCGGLGEPCGTGNKPYFRPFNNVTRGQSAKIVANTFYPNCQTP